MRVRTHIHHSFPLRIMTTTPPARHQLWHPARGISFSPSLQASWVTVPEPPLSLNGKIIPPTVHGVEHIPAPQQPSFSNLVASPRPKTPEVKVRGDNAFANRSEGTTEADKRPVAHELPPAVLDFKIDEELFYAAKNAPAGSPESFWSYAHYRGPLEDGKPRRVKVHYCRSRHTMERVCQQYFMNEKVLGFDLEWVINSTREDDIRRNVSLIQLASPSHIALIHVAVFGPDDGFVAPSFKQIMEDPSITKVGVHIKGDTTRMRNHMGIDSKGLLELSHLYRLITFLPSKQYQNINKKLVPLATQVEEYLRLPLFKGFDVRRSDWSKSLSKNQVVYSASDAYAGLQLYATMEHHRKQMDPCPPAPHHAELNLPIRLSDNIKLETDDEATDDEAADDEATDTPEEVAAPVPGPFSDYLASVIDSIQAQIDNLKAQDHVSPDEKPQQKSRSTRKTSRTKQPASTKPSPKPKHSCVEAAEDTATCYLSTHPNARASFIKLRAYYLWYDNELDPKDVARMLRDPPLQESTVISYVLSAISSEGLPYNKERLRDELATRLHPAVWGKYPWLPRPWGTGTEAFNRPTNQP